MPSLKLLLMITTKTGSEMEQLREERENLSFTPGFVTKKQKRL